jgi:hypothetical protein
VLLAVSNSITQSDAIAKSILHRWILEHQSSKLGAELQIPLSFGKEFRLASFSTWISGNCISALNTIEFVIQSFSVAQ